MKEYCVIINKDASIYSGEKISCETRARALNIASALARAYYNISSSDAHILVVENIDTVKYHYEIVFEKDVKMLLIFDGICNNRRVIAKTNAKEIIK